MKREKGEGDGDANKSKRSEEKLEKKRFLLCGPGKRGKGCCLKRGRQTDLIVQDRNKNSRTVIKRKISKLNGRWLVDERAQDR